MKAIKEHIKTEYYKYQYTDWEQPVLTANGTVGGNSFACYAGSAYSSNTPYKVFDGNNSTAWCSYNTNKSDYLVFYIPTPVIIKNILCVNHAWIMGKWEFYASDSGADFELLTSGENTNSTNGSTFTIDLSSNNKERQYYKIVGLTTISNQRVGMGEMQITAKIKNVIESDESDYDFLIERNVYKLPKINDKHYAIKEI